MASGPHPDRPPTLAELSFSDRGVGHLCAAVHALAATLPPERHAFAARVQGVIDEHSDLQERAGLKRAGYLAALTAALRARSVPEITTAVAADLGLLAFHTAYTRWVKAPPGPSLTDLTREERAPLSHCRAELRPTHPSHQGLRLVVYTAHPAARTPPPAPGRGRHAAALTPVSAGRRPAAAPGACG